MQVWIYYKLAFIFVPRQKLLQTPSTPRHIFPLINKKIFIMIFPLANYNINILIIIIKYESLANFRYYFLIYL